MRMLAQGYAEATEGGLGSLEQMGLGMGKMQAAMEAHNSAESSVDEPVMVLSYSEERARRVLYQDKDLHLLVGLFPHLPGTPFLSTPHPPFLCCF